jgi:two-component system LytT family sensor kinase
MRLAPSRRTLVNAGLLAAAWTAYGALSAWQSHYWYSFSKEPLSWPDALRYEVTYAWLWALITPAILWAAHRWRIERGHLATRLPIHLLAITICVVVTKTAFDALAMPPQSAFREFTWLKLLRTIEVTADTAVLLYFVIVLLEHAWVYYRRYQQGLINAGNLRTELVHAQLQALKMQLHPHFLFNTLHTVSELVHEDPDLAERTIARLSELLRFFMASSTIHEVPLGEELRILDLYLEIERTRFRDRLSVNYHVPAELREAMVPSLLLQPLVENAIRHGFGRKTGPGKVAITAERRGETLVLRVTDNGAGLNGSPSPNGHSGMGLAITRGRLQSLYGDRQSLEMRGLESGGVEVRVTMAFHRGPEQIEDTENATLQSIDRG